MDEPRDEARAAHDEPSGAPPPGDDFDPGDSREAVDELMQLAYDEFKAIAARMRRDDPFATLSTQTLVHEAWARIAASKQSRYHSPEHIRNTLIRKMRHLLVDSARSRRAAKRSGIVITVNDAIPLPADPVDRVLAIDEALHRLEELDPQQAAIVEARFFGGLSFAEIAKNIGVSESTVYRKWDAARLLLQVWLKESG